MPEPFILTVDFSVGPLFINGTVVKDNYAVHMGKEVGCPDDQGTGLAMEGTFLEDGSPNTGVKGSKEVVQKVDV